MKLIKKQNKLLMNIFACFMLFALMSFSVNATQTAVDLRTAGDFVILARSGISTTGITLITGDIGVSPIDSTAITGFGLIRDSSNAFARSSLITGRIYAADYVSATSTKMTTAVNDMKTAYTDAAGRSNPTATELGAGNIDGMTLAPGLYKWGTGVEIPNGVTLSGGANDVWIFQIAQDLTVGNGAIITLSSGAQAKNIFWVVAGQTTLGTTSDFKGIILSKTAIIMNTGAKLNGRALAQTAVTIDSGTVKAPTSSTTTTSTTTTSTTDSSTTTSTTTPSTTTPPTTTTTTTSTTSSGSASSGSGNQNNEQTNAINEELTSGHYTNSLGQTISVNRLTRNMKELSVNGVSARTDLNITAITDSQGKTKFTAKLRNEQEREIMMMPDAASEKALEMLRIRVCSSDNNCTIQLKNVGNGATEKIQYELQAEKNSKILGIFPKKMQVRAHVDAQTGETKVYKPWWAFMAREQTE